MIDKDTQISTLRHALNDLLNLGPDDGEIQIRLTMKDAREVLEATNDDAVFWERKKREEILHKAANNFDRNKNMIKIQRTTRSAVPETMFFELKIGQYFILANSVDFRNFAECDVCQKLEGNSAIRVLTGNVFSALGRCPVYILPDPEITFNIPEIYL